MATFEVLTSSNVIGGGGGSGSSYLVYTALMAQSGASAPTIASELANTLGVGTWTRNNTGDYQATTTTTFDLTKIYVAGQLLDSSSGTSFILIGSSSGIIGRYQYYFEANGEGKMVIFMYIYDDAGVQRDLSYFGFNYLCLEEIRVYP